MKNIPASGDGTQSVPEFIPTPERGNEFRVLSLPDGRRLAYAQYGDPEGTPVIYCHGFPASRLEARLFHAAACRQRVRLIAPDRPGFGHSTWQPQRRITDWPQDVSTLVDALAIGRFSLIGMSGGGPYALVCAAAIPERLAGVMTLGALGPVYQPWARREMKWSARIGFGLGHRAPWLLHLVYGGINGRIMHRYPRIIMMLLAGGAPQADREFLCKPEIETVLLTSMRESLNQGPRAVVQELKIYADPWSFTLEKIPIPIHLWHGKEDNIVPLSHAQFYLRTLPQVQSNLLAGEGHFSLPLRHIDNILQTLTPSQ